LLALFSSLIYGITVYMPKFFNASEAELHQLRNEFFTARASLTPGDVDVTQEAIDAYNEIEKAGQLPQKVIESMAARRDYKKAIADRIRLRKRAAGPGHRLLWEFNNVTPHQFGIWRRLLGGKLVRGESDQSLFIRFKYDVAVNPPDLQIYGRWFAGDYRQIMYGTPIKTPIRYFDRNDLIRTFHEIEVPVDVIAEDGYLAVGFLNVPLNHTTVIFPLEDGLEVLYKADTFGANFIRAVLLILFRLIFLACLGLLAATFLSFPVAILLCLVIFFTATMSGFIIESFGFLSKNVSSFYSYTIRPMILLLPRFDNFNSTKFLVPARLLSWLLVAKGAGLMVGVKAVLLLLLALLIFSFKEIAKIII